MDKKESKLSKDTIMTIGAVEMMLGFIILFAITMSMLNGMFNIRMVIMGILGVILFYSGIKSVKKAKKMSSIPNDIPKEEDNISKEAEYIPQKNNDAVKLSKNVEGEADIKKTVQKGEIDDLSYVKKIQMTKLGNWFMYDVLLDARPLGWEQIVIVVNSIAKLDMVHVDKLEVSQMAGTPVNLMDEYEKSGHEIVNMPTLKKEASNIAIAGSSKRAGLVQVVFFNQTSLIKFMTMEEKEDTIRRYTETIARKSFDTPDDMKLGRPHES